MDDIALRSENLKNLVLALPYLESNASKVGLVIISANPVYDNQEHPSIIFLKSLNIVSKEANNFKYPNPMFQVERNILPPEMHKLGLLVTTFILSGCPNFMQK